jgi:sortase A
VIGRLEIPRLGVRATAREGTDAGTLRRAVGHVPDTALPGEPGNAAFAGHRDTFFRSLRHIRVGDEILVRTLEGIHSYTVRETRVVKPRDVWVLDPTPGATLTLVTCHPFSFLGPAPNRFIVRATLSDGPPAAN